MTKCLVTIRARATATQNLFQLFRNSSRGLSIFLEVGELEVASFKDGDARSTKHYQGSSASTKFFAKFVAWDANGIQWA